MATKRKESPVEIETIQSESTGTEQKKETESNRYRIPPLYLDKVKDAETIKSLAKMVDESPYKSESDLIRQMVRVMLPVIKDHPLFSTKAAIATMMNSLSSKGEQNADEYSNIIDELTTERTIEY